MHSGKNRLVMYQQLKEGILHDISSGRLGAGAKLPSERELCRAYSVSRVTVRRAILDLVSEGILETVPGKGTYVRGLRQGKNATGYIAFVRCVRAARASSITDDVFYPAILAGLEAAAAARGYHCVVHTVNETQPDRHRLAELAERVDGIVCAELRHEGFLGELRALGLPIVLVSPSLVTADVDVVEIDNVGGAVQGVRYLLELGHRKIAFIRGSPDSRPSQEREAGFRRAFEQEGIALEGDMAAGAGWRLEDGYQAMRELLARESRYTAVFAASDLLALGAYQAIREAGLEVGKDISVLGFDNIELAAESLPPLSTVSVRRHEMGDTAARLLFESLDGGRGYPVRIVLPTVLVQRASTVAVPAVKGAATPGVVRKP